MMTTMMIMTMTKMVVVILLVLLLEVPRMLSSAFHFRQCKGYQHTISKISRKSERLGSVSSSPSDNIENASGQQHMMQHHFRPQLSTQHKVCIVLPSVKEDPDLSVTGHRNWIDEAISIAERIDIPYLTVDELLETFFNVDGHEENRSFHDTVTSSPPVIYTHIMRLIPYEYGIVNNGLGTGHDLTKLTYALAIESLEGHQRDGDKQQRKKRKRIKLSSNPFFIDFDPYGNSKTRQRATSIGGSSGQKQKDLLVQAVKLPSESSSTFVIHDWTAGLGQDSTILALQSCASQTQVIVRMFERDPVVGALLEDGIRRLNLLSSNETALVEGGSSREDSHNVRQSLSQRLRLTLGDGKDMARTHLQSSSTTSHSSNYHVESPDENHNDPDPMSATSSPFDPRPDVIYLDPMFPPRQKSAAVKKGMKLLQELLETQQHSTTTKVLKGTVGDGIDDLCQKFESNRLDDEAELLQTALDCARVRVVVKRPIKAPPLGLECSGSGGEESRDGRRKVIPKPSYDLKGSINRFDVYVVR
jgi:hypothetical protein